jgi:glycosyltransferase involved in cell wall biosynthesis
VAADVSVALCTYNGEKFIAAQLESILGQSLLPSQIVISDDGSTDKTLAVVKSVLTPARLSAAGITLTTLRRDKPMGVTKNFETALAACTGEFISLCDQDDVWHPERLARLRAAFSSDDVLLVHSDARMVDTDGVPLGQTLLGALGAGRRELLREQGPRGFEVLVRRNLVTGATTMVRRNLTRAAMPFPASWVHDYWLAVVAALGGRIVLDRGQLIDYRQHEANQIGATKLTPRKALEMLGHSRRARHEARVQRLADLAARCDDGSVVATTAQRTFVAEKLSHERTRLALPDSRKARLPAIWREFFSGRYHRFSRGMRDVVRDALSPS